MAPVGERPRPTPRSPSCASAMDGARSRPSMAAPDLDAEAEVRAFVPLTSPTPRPWACCRRPPAAPGPARPELGRRDIRRPAHAPRHSSGGRRFLRLRSWSAAEDVSRGSRAPMPTCSTARELGVSPSECLVVEDAPAGVQPRARRHDGRGCHHDPPLDQLGADACAESLAGSTSDGSTAGRTAASGWRSWSSSPS